MHQVDAAELARVAETQFAAIVQFEHRVGVAVGWRVGRDDGQMARHLEMDDERLVVAEGEDQVFAAPFDGLDVAAGDPPVKFIRRCDGAASRCARR